MFEIFFDITLVPFFGSYLSSAISNTLGKICSKKRCSSVDLSCIERTGFSKLILTSSCFFSISFFKRGEKLDTN